MPTCAARSDADLNCESGGGVIIETNCSLYADGIGPATKSGGNHEVFLDSLFCPDGTAEVP